MRRRSMCWAVAEWLWVHAAAAATAAATGDAATAGLEVAWNSPWPTNCPAAYKATVPADAISRFGVSTNAGNAFNGGVVTTLYNNPTRMTVGDWPCFAPNGTALNGGIPQRGDLDRHLAKVKSDIAARLPVGFDGYAVIDWEVWVPWFSGLGPTTPTSYVIYWNESIKAADGDVAAAARAWNHSALEFMVRTLEVAQEVRPQGKFGYYGMVQCTFDVATERCPPRITAINDWLAPLWKASTALYPELYASCNFSGSPPSCDPTDKITKKIAARLTETRRIVAAFHGEGPKVAAFSWYALDDGRCTKDVGHCPLMRSPTDLHAEFEQARSGGADAVIVWGSSGDISGGVPACEEVGEYLQTTLGPVLNSAAAGAAAAAAV